MAVNKIVYAGNSLIDLTDDTVTADKLSEGITAHDKSGNKITGTMSGSRPIYAVSGSFTLAEDTKRIIVEHSLGVVPNFAVIYYNVSYNPSGKINYRPIMSVAHDGKESGFYWKLGPYSETVLASEMMKYDLTSTKPPSPYNTAAPIAISYNANESTITFGYSDSTKLSDYYLGASVPWYWIVGVIG